jgi:hypothetical protein
MVRRWSYINFINCGGLISSRAMPKASADVNMNTLMYLKKRYAPATRLTRKQWARRKHFHNWIAPMNVLKDWAKTYRFHRNHAKVVYYQFFSKHSFLAFNLVAARNSIPALNKGSEDVVTGAYTRRLIRYFQRYSNPRIQLFNSFGHSRVLAISYYTNDPYSEVSSWFDGNRAVVPLLSDLSSSAIHWEQSQISSEQATSLLIKLLNLTLTLFLTQLLDVYKTLILLSLSRLR